MLNESLRVQCCWTIPPKQTKALCPLYVYSCGPHGRLACLSLSGRMTSLRARSVLKSLSTRACKAFRRHMQRWWLQSWALLHSLPYRQRDSFFRRLNLLPNSRPLLTGIYCKTTIIFIHSRYGQSGRQGAVSNWRGSIHFWTFWSWTRFDARKFLQTKLAPWLSLTLVYIRIKELICTKWCTKYGFFAFLIWCRQCGET